MSLPLMTEEEALDILGDEYKKLPKERVSKRILNYMLLVTKIVDSLYEKNDSDINDSW